MTTQTAITQETLPQELVQMALLVEQPKLFVHNGVDVTEVDYANLINAIVTGNWAIIPLDSDAKTAAKLAREVFSDVDTIAGAAGRLAAAEKELAELERIAPELRFSDMEAWLSNMKRQAELAQIIKDKGTVAKKTRSSNGNSTNNLPDFEQGKFIYRSGKNGKAIAFKVDYLPERFSAGKKAPFTKGTWHIIYAKNGQYANWGSLGEIASWSQLNEGIAKRVFQLEGSNFGTHGLTEISLEVFTLAMAEAGYKLDEPAA